MDANQNPQTSQKFKDFNTELEELCKKYQFELRATISTSSDPRFPGAILGLVPTVQVFDVSPKEEGVPLDQSAEQPTEEVAEPVAQAEVPGAIPDPNPEPTAEATPDANQPDAVADAAPVDAPVETAEVIEDEAKKNDLSDSTTSPEAEDANLPVDKVEAN